jgi:arylsulfatase A-like enzyme
MRCALLAAVAAVGASARAPNIIWLQTDSMDGRLLDPTSPYWWKTKSVDFKQSLTDGGVAFARHYTNSPQCVPSRTR